MDTAEVDQLVATVLSDRRLLLHPFYRRWEAGELSMSDLASYAAQYRHFERFLPEFLHELHEALPEGPARNFVRANLDDELGDPIPHTDLFEEFAQAVGANEEAVSPAMAALISTYEALVRSGPESGLAGFLAYESQAAEVARNKADTLGEHYGLRGSAVAFWEHHAEVDLVHQRWTLDARVLERQH
jgi:pyrroloquinoline-quinone synthase